MAETEEEKKTREAKEAKEAKEAEEAKKAETARLAAEQEDKKKNARQHNPNGNSPDVTADFLDKEWQPFKKRNAGLFADPTATTTGDAGKTTETKRPHAETCFFGPLCPFPNESHE